MRHIEQKLQEWYALYLSSLGVLYCASAGGMRVSLGTAVKMKRAGYKKGTPDIFIYEPRGVWHGMAVEVKAGSKPTVEQIERRDALNKKGYYAIIVPSKLDYWQARDWLISETDRYLGHVQPVMTAKALCKELIR